MSAAALVPDPAAASAPYPAPFGRAWHLALRGGPAAQLRYLEQHWRQLWQRPSAGPVPEDWLAELDGLPPFPDRTPWTGTLVRDILRRLKPRKAPGLDGWSVAELRLLPDELLDLVAELFEAVEGGAPWPDELCAPEGLLLPKGGADEAADPLSRRPVWLFPMLYRVWAAGRAHTMASWVASWAGDAHGLGAEDLAWELALELEGAEAAGEAICGAALDWRKAFDHVLLDHLAPSLQRAGVPD